MDNRAACQSLIQAHSEIRAVMVSLAIQDIVQPDFSNCIDQLLHAVEATSAVCRNLRWSENSNNRRYCQWRVGDRSRQ